MKIAIIGAGNMGGAIARGLALTAQGTDIFVSNPSTSKLDALREDFPSINTTTCNSEAAQGADIVFLAVKPWKMEEVIAELKPTLDYEKQIIVSVAGGVGSDSLDGWLQKGGEPLPALYIVIPNTAIVAREGVTFIRGKRTAEAADRAMLALFSPLGLAMMVSEELIPAGTSLASCGIAYALQYIRAAAEGGEELGFSAADAQAVVMQTIKGALSVLAANGTTPETEINRVTTPGGLTLKGLAAMEAQGFSKSVAEGLQASTKK
ncbi:MAG: pyrroline-5-carboxylate reductase [Bacteroidaceae bacterium]|nr:pyrroline-5-carboxylate reductase [Bacteroidaceae bacterium]